MKSKLYNEILTILKSNKYEGTSFTGPYPYSDEEKAEMIVKLIDKMKNKPTAIKKEEVCKACNGDGYTAEHDLPSRHGENGECISCPVQVQCESCEGTGFVLIENE